MRDFISIRLINISPHIFSGPNACRSLSVRRSRFILYNWHHIPFLWPHLCFLFFATQYSANKWVRRINDPARDETLRFFLCPVNAKCVSFVCGATNGDWKKYCKIDPPKKTVKGNGYIVCVCVSTRTKEEFLFNPLLDTQSMVCVCPLRQCSIVSFSCLYVCARTHVVYIIAL